MASSLVEAPEDLCAPSCTRAEQPRNLVARGVKRERQVPPALASPADEKEFPRAQTHREAQDSMDQDSFGTHTDGESDGSGSGHEGDASTETSTAGAPDRRKIRRERNRQHARRTRERKKAQLNAMKAQLQDLHAERCALEQRLEERRTAYILLHIASPVNHATTGEAATTEAPHQADPASTPCDAVSTGKAAMAAATTTPTTAKAKRAVALVQDPVTNELHMTRTQHTPLAGPLQSTPHNFDRDLTDDGSHGADELHAEAACASDQNAAPLCVTIQQRGEINWKKGIALSADGSKRALSPTDLERLRRERNRLHAKMTRERKKEYVANLERDIRALQLANERLRGELAASFKRPRVEA